LPRGRGGRPDTGRPQDRPRARGFTTLGGGRSWKNPRRGTWSAASEAAGPKAASSAPQQGRRAFRPTAQGKPSRRAFGFKSSAGRPSQAGVGPKRGQPFRPGEAGKSSGPREGSRVDGLARGRRFRPGGGTATGPGAPGGAWPRPATGGRFRRFGIPPGRKDGRGRNSSGPGGRPRPVGNRPRRPRR